MVPLNLSATHRCGNKARKHQDWLDGYSDNIPKKSKKTKTTFDEVGCTF